MNIFTLLSNYFRASIRNIKKNGLFTFINVIGLAISISVGLLVLTFINEINTYDTFHEDSGRIYRINNTHKYLDRDENLFASTSILAHEKISQSATGIEGITLLRRRFTGDMELDDKKVPIQGLYANEGFFDVLSFSMIEGDPTTALKEPYSMVLTQESAIKLFGRSEDIVGEVLGHNDSLSYTITGLIEDIPRNSHMDFEVLTSFSTIDNQRRNSDDTYWMKWTNMWQNYIYLKLSSEQDLSEFQAQLDKISEEENALDEHTKINLSLQPLLEIVPGKEMSNQIGQQMTSSIVWMLAGLAFIVIISACFNYTNLSMAKSINRNKEVGVRKTIGASRSQVFAQFIVEAVIIALISLVLAFVLFLLVRPQFLQLQFFSELVRLELTLPVVVQFIGLSLFAGFLGGILPALYFSRLSPGIIFRAQQRSRKTFRRVGLRKVLIVFQFFLSLAFILSASLEYNQYRHSLSFDLGYKTDNILNLNLQGNKIDIVKNELQKMPQVADMSSSLMITSTGSIYGESLKYQDPMDSITVYYNQVDDNYIPLHKHQLIAGNNFSPQSENSEESQVIVNKKVLRELGIFPDDPEKAIGEEVLIDGKDKARIVGVSTDFHYGTTRSKVEPFMLWKGPEPDFSWINIKYQTDDVFSWMENLEKVWAEIDPIHPLDARFYDEQIQRTYSGHMITVKVIGFLAFLAMTIAFLGLLGMVIFTTESRLKELSIRKIFGANISNLIYTVGKGFIVLLLISAVLAIPLTYLFFQQVVYIDIPYKAPVGVVEMTGGVLLVFILAVASIVSQTLNAARKNPAEVLRNE